ncbi:MAG TPA: NADP-dependent malic enzyme [Nitrososphaerales archaeon]|nr:NADP-dependent malic enzyme [Nitrososphaerales archaeon]
MKKQKGMPDAAKKALAYSKFYGGKIGVVPKVPVHSLQDFSVWYTPGVGAVSMAIHADTNLSYDYTNRWNTIAVITDGTRVLGLGNIGPEASLPVMEGKALIYKFLGGVDAHALPLRVADSEQFIATVKALEPSLGGINLEDIESPKCFGILERLRSEMQIPVWHDDQQGTAGVILAGLYNALKVTDRTLKGTRIVFLGAGAANIAAARLLIQAGADPGDLVMLDSKGILHPEREDIDQLLLRNKWKYEIAIKTNRDRLRGGLETALKGADVLVAAAGQGPNLVKKKEVGLMNKRAVTFLLANPVPEMWPSDAHAAGAEVVATGRSDFPNQVNNSLLFPAIFRGALDVRAKTITDKMVIAAAKELAAFTESNLTAEHIIPDMDDWVVYARVAAALGMAAQKEGQARLHMTEKDLLRSAVERIEHSRKTMKVLVESGIIAEPPK